MRPDNEQPCGHSGYRTVQNCIRVSVLDLDNTIFSAGRRMGGRGSNHVIRALSERNPPAPNRGGSLTREHHQCCYCISLYDVNSSDWTVKNCGQCLTVQSCVVWAPASIAAQSTADRIFRFAKDLVEPSGIEPLTS